MINDALKICGNLWLAWGLLWLVASLKTERTEQSEPFSSRIQHLIPIGIVFWFLFSSSTFGPWRYNGATLCWTGTLITAAGLGFAAWARYHLGRHWSGTITLKEGHQLIRTGPYRFARHPIYTGFLAGVIGSAIASGRFQGLVAVVLTLIVYIRKIDREELFLVERFGAEYRRYQQEVGALLPHLGLGAAKF